MLFLFLHIEKCGGTSLRHAFYDMFKTNYDDLFIQGIDKIHSNSKYDIEYVLTKNIVAYHEYYNSSFDATLYKISCIRNPVYRLLSHYHYFDKPRLKYESLIEFEKNNYNDFKNYVRSMGNLQVLKFYGNVVGLSDEKLENIYPEAVNNINKFDKIILFENLEEDLNSTREELKKKFKKINKVVLKNFNKTKENYLIYYDSEKLEEYKKYCMYDINLYNHVCDMRNLKEYKI